MGWVLRSPQDRTNPTLPGAVYGRYITAGIGVYWVYDGSGVRFVLFISDGGRYGMSDTDLKLSYKGGYINSSNWKFHPGIYTKQISAYPVSSVDASGDTVTILSNPFSNNDPVKFNSRGGNLPGNLNTGKFWVINKSGNTMQLSSTDPASSTTLVDIADAGSGSITVWKADAGWDDPDQGLPTWVPEVQTTFSGICYIEGKLTTSDVDEPDWGSFRIEGIGRKLMKYDSSGNELGVQTTEAELVNPANCLADVIIVEMDRPVSRINWPSYEAFRVASNVLVWERVDPNSQGTGIVGKYYSITGSSGPPSIPGDVTYVTSRRDTQIGGYWSGSSFPIEGVNVTDFVIIWEGFLKPQYTETYTFTVPYRDNGVRLTVNGSLIIDQWLENTASGDSGSIALTADVPVSFKFEYFNTFGPGAVSLQYSSPSTPDQPIPMSRFVDIDRQVARYEVHTAFAGPTETSTVMEVIIKRCPGWDWTDRDGEIVFLGPDRPYDYQFLYDALDDNVVATIVEGSFTKTRRHRRDRRNFALYSYRNRNIDGYPEEFVEENRPRLRELGNGAPTNDSPTDLMVMNRGQAQRIADLDFKLTTDPMYNISLNGLRASGVVTKSSLVKVQNFVQDDRKVEDSDCIVLNFSRQGKELSFSLLPIVLPFTTEELV